NFLHLIGSLLTAIPFLNCTGRDLLDTETPEPSDEILGIAQQTSTVWQALVADGWNPQPHPRFTDLIQTLNGYSAPDGHGWRIEVDGVLFLGASAKTKSITKGSRYRCYLTNA